MSSNKTDVTQTTEGKYYVSTDIYDDNEPHVMRGNVIVCDFPKVGSWKDRMLLAEKIVRALND